MTGVLGSIAVQKRDGRVATFDRERIVHALRGAFSEEYDDCSLSNEVETQLQTVTDRVVVSLSQHERLGVEAIQDEVEKQLMLDGYFSVARRYILYREARARARKLKGQEKAAPVQVRLSQGELKPLNHTELKHSLYRACHGLPETDPEYLLREVEANLYDGISDTDVPLAAILVARSRIEQDPVYSQVAGRLLLQQIYQQVFDDALPAYAENFSSYLEQGIEAGLLDPQLRAFDWERLAEVLDPERDERLRYLGIQTLYDRYLLHIEDRRIEAPQYVWMRVAMGLALQEENKTEQAIAFYDQLSCLVFLSATPTLFNAGTTHPQLSSCYLSTVEDDLQHIFKVVSDNAQLSKWAGGLGNDWTQVRATGSRIRGTNGKSQGLIPFLKIVNDTAVAVNQGGKRKGAVCCYLETWHLDIEEFLDLRKNTGDERRRTHDMNTAHWIPDLFMQRVEEDGVWTLFSPDDVRDLHDLYGDAFRQRYEEYERQANSGELKLYRHVQAKDLWRKMLSMLFETGHPWITFKDPSNLRSPQDHAGVIHSSNLCTEILLNTSRDETAVCNLGSINLAQHICDGKLDLKKLRQTVRTAIRMLDNVIDINFYPTEEARTSNLRHRPIGLGVMGFQDALYTLRLPYASEEAVAFADRSMEAISYYALEASADLAEERGSYSSFEGSKWQRGLLPIDTIALMGDHCMMDRSQTMDWDALRVRVQQGMRNCCVLAIAPTATIANISGVAQSIEPSYRNLFVKSNLSGEFTVVNSALVADLKKRGLWDAEMLDDLKYYDGSVQEIERVPDDLKRLYPTAFEIDTSWILECASRRQKWLDMGQSLNLYLAQPRGQLLHDMYFQAWKLGLKTTYYLRSLGATQVEKSSVDITKRAVQPRWMKSESASSRVQACSIDDPECEACQ